MSTRQSVLSNVSHTVVSLFVVLSGQISHINAQPESKRAASDTDVGVFELSVIDMHTGHPLPLSDLDIEINDQHLKRQTNDEGRCKLKLDQPNLELLRIEVFKRGYVAMVLCFRPKATGIPIPPTFELRLEQGIQIGGIVQTDNNTPVSGARVKIDVLGYMQYASIIERTQNRIVCTTDAEGRWACHILPELSRDVLVDLEHNVYVRSSQENIPIVALKSGDHVLRVQPGLSLSGMVLNLNGLPIVDATLSLGKNRHQAEQRTTDAQGMFRFNKLKPRQQLLTVIAEGYAQDVKVVDLEKDRDDIVFTLVPGRPKQFRIVDVNGTPILGASVEATKWRRRRDRYARISNIHLRAETDENGFAVLKDCPEDDICCSVTKPGYTKIEEYCIRDHRPVHFIQMRPQGRIHGRVYDMQSRKPISTFRMFKGVRPSSSERLWWNKQWVKYIQSGEFELGLEKECMAVGIEADGFQWGETSVVCNDSNDHHRDIFLEPIRTREVTGSVRKADGTPVGRCNLWVATDRHRLFVQGLRTLRHQGFTRGQSDDLGRFVVKVPQSDNFSILILHDEGFSEISESQFEESSPIVLTSWARAEGNVSQGNGGVLIGVEMSTFDDKSEDLITYVFEASVDVNGRYSFERVKPGKATMSKIIGTGTWSRNIDTRHVELFAGRTTQVNF